MKVCIYIENPETEIVVDLLMVPRVGDRIAVPLPLVMATNHLSADQVFGPDHGWREIDWSKFEIDGTVDQVVWNINRETTAWVSVVVDMPSRTDVQDSDLDRMSEVVNRARYGKKS